ncbi:MAG TPA: glycosyltransferase [Kofleriaceae bacterium]|nr:glycosyltransferase [Kofleriaceae bacterium]
MSAWLLVGGVALLVGLASWHGWLARAIARRVVPSTEPVVYPSVTMVRPVRGLDVDAEANFRAALETSYPGEVETLFVFDDADDPGVPVARRVVDEHRRAGRRGDAQVVLSGRPPAHRTGKVQAMIVGAARARGTLIGFGDSDSRPTPDLLTALVRALLVAPDVGASFAPVVVADPPETAGDVGYALLVNAVYGPMVARATDARGGLPFIMGQAMVFRPEALAAIGGPACADGQLIDDMHLGRCLNQAGYATVMIREPLRIVNHGTSLGAFLRLYRRWMLFGRDGLPLRITWPSWPAGIAAWLGAALLVTALAVGAGWAALVAASALVAQGVSLARLHERFGGAPIPWRWRVCAGAVFLIAPAVLVSMRSRQVEWRGRHYVLDRLALPVQRERGGSSWAT